MPLIYRHRQGAIQLLSGMEMAVDETRRHKEVRTVEFWTAGYRKFRANFDNTIVFYKDINAVTPFELSAYERRDIPYYKLHERLTANSPEPYLTKGQAQL